MTIGVTHSECAVQRVVKHVTSQIVRALFAYLENDIRVTLAKHSENVAQMGRERITVIPEAQGMSGLFGCNVRHRASNLRKNFARGDEKPRSLFRQDETPTASPLKQGTTEFLLHLTYLLSKRRLRHMAKLRGPRKTQRLCGLFEIGKLTQFHGIPFRPKPAQFKQPASHLCTSSRHDPSRTTDYCSARRLRDRDGNTTRAGGNTLS